jgi:hypothetical protein
MNIPETRVDGTWCGATLAAALPVAGGQHIIAPRRSVSADNAELPPSCDAGVPSLGVGKVLVRSHAMCGDDDTKLSARALNKQSSSMTGSELSRGVCHICQTQHAGADSSTEIYTDSTGIDLEKFIVNTLHKNVKDRAMMLEIENELRRFVSDAR